TGTLTFELFDSGDQHCDGVPLQTRTVTVAGRGDYDSPDITIAHPGTFHWSVSYDGDANDDAARICEEENVSVVDRLVPAVPQAPTAATVGQPVNDVATLAGGLDATGTVTFTASTRDDCAEPVFTTTVSVSGDGTYGASFTPPAAGRYYWQAAYDG